MGNTTGNIYNIAIYERLSKTDVLEEGKVESESIRNQSNLINNFIKELKKNEPENEFKVIKEYVDDGYTGTNFERPAFKQMMEDIKNGTINFVISKNLDRLGRNAIKVLDFYQNYFPENNIRYMTVLDDHIDTNKDTEDIMVYFKALFGEMYPKQLSKNIKKVKESKAKQGLFQGNTAPYGYKKSTKDKHKLVIDKTVSPIIRKIFSMYAGGYTRHDIVQYLNSQKILPPRKYLKMEKTEKGLFGVDKTDYSWKEHTITKIIGNPVYIGTMVGAKTIKPSFKKKNRKCNKKENQIIVLNTHEPIIELELFNRCQEIRKKHLDRQLKYDNIYKGLVHCGECGKICNLKHREKENKNGSKSEIFSFVCSEANKGLTKKCDNTKSISAKKLDSLILPILEKQCKAISINDKDIKEIVTTINTNFNFEINRLKEEKKQYVQNIENIKLQIKQIYRDKLENTITGDLFVSISKEKQREVEQYQKLIEEIDRKIKLENDKKVISFEEVQSIANEFINNEKITKDLISKLVKRIEIDNNRKITIQFTFANILKETC